MENMLLQIVRLTQLFKRRQPVPSQQSQVIIFLSTTLTLTHRKVGQELPESYCLPRSTRHPPPPVIPNPARSPQQTETMKCQMRTKDERNAES